MKVFELAKDLDTKALDLIEKIKPLNLSIKNHMSELSDDQVVKIREFLSPPASASGAETVKPVVRRKKTAAPAPRSTIVIKRKKDSDENKIEDEAQAASSVVENEESVSAAPSAVTAPDDRVESVAPTTRAEASGTPAATTAPEKPTENAVAEAPKGVPAKPRRFSFIRVAESTPEELAIRRPVVIEDAALSEEVKKEYEDVNARKQDDDDHQSVERSAADILRELEKEEAQGRRKGGFSFKDTAQTNEFRSTDYLRRERVYSLRKKKLSFGRAPSKISTVAPSDRKRVIGFEDQMSVEELADALSVKVRQVALKLDSLGIERPDEAENFSDWILDVETVQVIAAEFGYEVKDDTVSEEKLINAEEHEGHPVESRPPVVTIMGHVDHGKTSLLDFIRRARVVAKEAGGITQHIGAYTVKVADAVKNINSGLEAAAEEKGSKKAKEKAAPKNTKAGVDKKAKVSKEVTAAHTIPQITFLDTPGHAAFSSMRARGAQVTDIVILVVAASEGLMPQTREAVDHAKAAGVPVIVAINKMDLPDANPDKILQQLSELGILSEEWGGETLVARISAKTGLGIADLLEKIQLQAEILELTARKDGPARGIIIEAHLDKGRGSVATALIGEGTVKVGDYVAVGMQSSRVRALIDDQGKNIREAGPSMPVLLLGLTEVPEAGDPMNVVEDERKAKDLVDLRIRQNTEASGSRKMTMEEMMRRMSQGEIKELPIILKGDVKGSVEAIQGALAKLPSEKVKLRVLSAAVGGISENDVVLASASKALVIGFNVRPDVKSIAEAERLGVEIKTYDIIYKLLDDIVLGMEGLLAPTVREETLGQAEVRNVFNLTKVGTIAGCFVVSGKILRAGQVRVLRQQRIVYTGNISGLKRFKDDVKEVAQGYECGISVENFNDIKDGDILECFKQVESVTKLEGPSVSA